MRSTCSRLLQHRDTWVIASEETQRHSRNFNTFKPRLLSAKVNSVKFVKPEQAVRSNSQSRVFCFRISTKTVSQSQLLQFFKFSTRNEEFDLVININALDVRRDETWLQSRTLSQAKYESLASRQSLLTFLKLKSCAMVKWGNICRNTTSSQGRLEKFDGENEERTSAILVYLGNPGDEVAVKGIWELVNLVPSLLALAVPDNLLFLSWTVRVIFRQVRLGLGLVRYFHLYKIVFTFTCASVLRVGAGVTRVKGGDGREVVKFRTPDPYQSIAAFVTPLYIRSCFSFIC